MLHLPLQLLRVHHAAVLWAGGEGRRGRVRGAKEEGGWGAVETGDTHAEGITTKQTSREAEEEEEKKKMVGRRKNSERERAREHARYTNTNGCQ